MEESFPRGGNEPKPEEEKSSGEKSHRKKKRSLDKDDAAEKASEDFLFGAPKRSSSSKRKKHKKGSKEEFGHSANNKHSLLPLGGGGVSFKKNLHKESLGIASKPEPFIEALGFSKLDKGTKLLGIVREVQDDFVVFSLPNLLTGYVLRNEVSVVFVFCLGLSPR